MRVGDIVKVHSDSNGEYVITDVFIGGSYFFVQKVTDYGKPVGYLFKRHMNREDLTIIAKNKNNYGRNYPEWF